MCFPGFIFSEKPIIFVRLNVEKITFSLHLKKSLFYSIPRKQFVSIKFSEKNFYHMKNNIHLLISTVSGISCQSDLVLLFTLVFLMIFYFLMFYILLQKFHKFKYLKGLTRIHREYKPKVFD